MDKVQEIKERIKDLENQIVESKQELKDVCPHKNIALSFDKYLYKDDFLFICNNCGMHFVTEDINFKASDLT